MGTEPDTIKVVRHASPATIPMTHLPTTSWSLVLSSRAGNVDSDAALATLCEGYRGPVLQYLRQQTGDIDQAEDLTQGFFEHFLLKRLHERADPVRGRFRGFLFSCVRNFVHEQRAFADAARRGGGQQHVSLDGVELSLADDAGPEAAFDRAFAQTVLQRAQHRLVKEALAAGKLPMMRALEPYLGENPAPDDYARLSEELGMRRNTLAVAVFRMRQRFQELVRAELSETLLDPNDLDDELGVLGRAMAGR